MLTVKGVKAAGVSVTWVGRRVQAATKALGRKNDDLAIVFQTAAQIKELNRVYRNKDEATDVLSFPAETARDLGDIFIAPVMAKKKAKNRGMNYRDYLSLLVVHSVLHLAGYDHANDREARTMEAIETKILKKF